jgi:methyl-accepting chemotaxis protein
LKASDPVDIKKGVILKKAGGLSIKILIVTSLVVLVFGLTLVSVMTRFMNTLTDTVLVDTLQHMAKTAALTVEGNLHMLADRIFLIRDRLAVIPPEAPRELEQAVLDQAMGGIEFVWLGLYGAEGELLTGSPRCPQEIGTWALHSMMEETGNLVIADTYAGEKGLEIVLGTPAPGDRRSAVYLTGSYKYVMRHTA